MRGRILSLRWRKLTQIGFIVDNRLSGLRNFGGWLNGFSKHPATLIAFGFLLTGLIGNYLAQRQGERKQESDAVVKSMDEIRTSIDELAVGFSDFQFRANRLIKLEEQQGRYGEIMNARTEYDEAVQRWKEKLVVDEAKIGGRYLEMTGIMSVGFIVGDINFAADSVDECLNSNIRKQGSNPMDISLACKNENVVLPDSTIPGVTAESRMWILSTCVRYFTNYMWPDPIFDFNDRGIMAAQNLNLVNVVCDPKRQNESPQQMNEAFAKELKDEVRVMGLKAPAFGTESKR